MCPRGGAHAVAPTHLNVHVTRSPSAQSQGRPPRQAASLLGVWEGWRRVTSRVTAEVQEQEAFPQPGGQVHGQHVMPGPSLPCSCQAPWIPR